MIAHPRSSAVITSTNGAARFSTFRKSSMPRTTIDDVDRPENREAHPLGHEVTADRTAAPSAGQPGHERAEERLQRLPADPRVDAEPPARDERAHHRGDVRAVRAVRRAREHRKRNSVFRARVRVREDRHEHDEVADEDRDERLPPVHPERDEARRERCTSGCSGPSRSTAPRTCTWSTCAARRASARDRGCRWATTRATPRRLREARRVRLRAAGALRPSRIHFAWHSVWDATAVM